MTTSEQWEEVVISGKGLWKRHDTGGNVASEMYKIEIAWGRSAELLREMKSIKRKSVCHYYHIP